VPFDRRVWLECQTLRAAGHQVAVVCPKGKGDPAYAVVEGVELYKYRPYSSTSHKLSFVAEYLYSFLATLWLATKAARSGPFDAVQACNPPDIFWPIGLLFRALHGSRFVFDHHDLCPELYESRFPDGPRSLYRLLTAMEGLTVRTADRVIATNESYKSVEVRRHEINPDKVTVVRTGPDPARLKRGPQDPGLRRGRRFLVAYIGVMGPQDGVDIVLKVADLIVHEMRREDVSFTLIGSGDCFQDLVAMRDDMDLAGYVEFTGRAPDAEVTAILSTADLGLSPDPKNPLNDLSTMNKTMEYMSFELPVVAFDLRETRVSAAGAGVYATPNDVAEMARLVVELLDDENRRKAMGSLGRSRVEAELAWEHQASRYAATYQDLIAKRRSPAVKGA